MIERLYKQKLVDDEQFHNSRKDEFLANHRRQWGEDVADKARTARMLTDVEGFTVDVLARRARLGFLDRDAVLAAVPVVSGLLAAELGWNDDRSLSDRTEAIAYFV